MDVVDAHGGSLIHIGSHVDDWTLVAVKWRSLLTRTAIVRYDDGREAEVVMPVKLLPRLL